MLIVRLAGSTNSQFLLQSRPDNPVVLRLHFPALRGMIMILVEIGTG